MRPGVFDLSKLDARPHRRANSTTMFTAPHFGFKDAADYYYRASAMRVVDRIRVPALVITAEDDPFVPAGSRSATRRSPAIRTITLCISAHGGHCGFVGPTRARMTATGPKIRL